MNTRPEGLVRLPSFPYSTFNGRVRISSHAKQEKPQVSSAFLRNWRDTKGTNVMLPPLRVSNFCWQLVLSEIPLSPRIRTIAGPPATNTMEGRLMLNTSSDLCKQVVFQICQLVSNFAEFEAAKTEALTYGDTSRGRSGPDVPRRFSRRWQWKINYQTFALHFSEMRSNSIAMLGYQIQYQNDYTEIPSVAPPERLPVLFCTWKSCVHNASSSAQQHQQHQLQKCRLHCPAFAGSRDVVLEIECIWVNYFT